MYSQRHRDRSNDRCDKIISDWNRKLEIEFNNNRAHVTPEGIIAIFLI
jgi:hypothetical protein